jgi:Ni,Fe-hydrogenase I small subunit
LTLKALAVVTARTCAAFGGIHAIKGNPTGCMGVADYLGWDWKSKAGLPIVNVPGCPVQPDNFRETHQAVWRANPRFATLNDEPKWRHNRPNLTTGYQPPR